MSAVTIPSGIPPEPITLYLILQQLALNGSGGSGGNLPSGVSTPFASSIADAKSQGSSAVGAGNIVSIMNAVNAGELSFYQLQSGTPTQGSPAQFQPTDNSALVYTLVK